MHEELVRCTLQEGVDKYTLTPPKVILQMIADIVLVPKAAPELSTVRHAMQGEVTLVIDKAAPADDSITPDELRVQLASLLASGQSTSSAAKIASKQLGVPRREAYAAALALADLKEPL